MVCLDKVNIVWKHLDMSKTTLDLMVRIENRLNTLICLESTACGHEVLVLRAEASRMRLLKFIERELENLVKKAGRP